MQKHNQIKALFFLGTFSLLLLHNIVPHAHHQHEVEHAHRTAAYGDIHSHNHDVPEEENTDKGFLDFLFGAHVHSVVFNEIFVAQERSVTQVKVKKDVKTPASVVHLIQSVICDKADNIRVYHPPSNYFNRYLTCSDSRGPPTLG